MNCQAYLDKHLTGWTFRLAKLADINGKPCVAMTKHSTKEIFIHVRFKYASDEFLLARLQHEVAHAKVGRGKKHNEEWKKEALKLGLKNPKPRIFIRKPNFEELDYLLDEEDILEFE